jgi:hypothetical protein
MPRFFAEFTLSEMQRSFPFAVLRVRMTSEGLRMTPHETFSASR